MNIWDFSGWTGSVLLVGPVRTRFGRCSAPILVAIPVSVLWYSDSAPQSRISPNTWWVPATVFFPGDSEKSSDHTRVYLVP